LIKPPFFDFSGAQNCSVLAAKWLIPKFLLLFVPTLLRLVFDGSDPLGKHHQAATSQQKETISWPMFANLPETDRTKNTMNVGHFPWVSILVCPYRSYVSLLKGSLVAILALEHRDQAPTGCPSHLQVFVVEDQMPLHFVIPGTCT